MKSRAIFFPFDLFGSGGTAAGAELLADATRELVADNRRERKPTRARAYARKLAVEEYSFATVQDLASWRADARRAARAAWDRGECVFWFTGNHLGVLPLYDELSARGGDTLVLQLDAHLDIYNLSDCAAELSHGNFLLHCDGPLPAVINVGHRELLLTAEYVARFYRHAFSASELHQSFDAVRKQVEALAASASRIVIDLDCDVFDPAFFPAVSHPQPFGLSPAQVLQLLRAAWSARVIGVAVSEFDPARDERDRGLSTLMWLFEQLLLWRHERTR